jgi:peptidyl-prolyl cis-trans isomerase B (cyclophilin B)
MERQLARRAARARRQRQVSAGVAIGIALVVILTVTGISAGWFKSKPKPATAATCTWTNTPTPSASAGASATPSIGKPPTSGEPRAGTETMSVALNSGNVTIQLDLAKSPCAAASFKYLGGKNFFNNSKCDEVSDVALYCGDPSGTGTGGPGYQFADEYLLNASANPSGTASPSATATASPTPSANPSSSASVTVDYPAGTVAMANVGPGTNGSRFFIVYKDTQLTASYTVIGKVTAGLDVVQKIGATGALDDSGKAVADGKPKSDVIIETLTVTSTASASSSSTPAASGSASATASPTAST